MLVIPLTELYGKDQHAFKLAEVLNYSLAELIRATIGIADGILGHCDLPMEAVREFINSKTTHLDNNRLINLLTQQVYDAAQRVLAYAPAATSTLTYIRTTHRCVYLYVTITKG